MATQSALEAVALPAIPITGQPQGQPIGKTDNQSGSENGHSFSDEEKAAKPTAANRDTFWEPANGVIQDDGVTKIEALYHVYGKGWGLLTLWGSIALISYAYALSQSTTWHYTPFATSAFGAHSLVGLIQVITGIMSGVAQPFIGKIADLASRPIALSVSVVFYAIGYAMTAGAKNIETVAAGQVIYTLGNTGISYMNGLLIADITSIQWRGAIQGAVTLPFILNAFVAGYITDGIGGYTGDGWRWGYGMFCIIIPVLITPAICILFAGDLKAKRLGALSLAAPSYYRAQVLAGQEPVSRPGFFSTVLHYWSRLNGFGLLLLGFAFACLLSPITLQYGATGGWKNPSMIALITIGGLLFLVWGVWDGKFAAYPIMPKRVFNRTYIMCVIIDFFYFFSGYLGDVYWDSWVWIVRPDYAAKEYTYYTNILTVGLCLFAFLAGLAQRYFHRYKYQQIGGLCIRIIGMGLQYAATKNPTTALLVSSRVLISLGGGMTVIASQVASQASVPHQDLAIAIAVLSLWTQLGGAVASAISASVWTKRVPAALEKYVGDVYNATGRAEIFSSINIARAAEPHDLIIEAYCEAFRPLILAGMCTAVLALIAGCFASNYYLGEMHNTIEPEKVMTMRNKEDTTEEAIAAKVRALEQQVQAEVNGNHPNQGHRF